MAHSESSNSSNGHAVDYCEVLDISADRWPDKVALIADDGNRWTFAEVRRSSDQVAAGLADLGIHRGDRVVLCLGNQPEWVFTFFALARLRAAAVMVSPNWMAHEVTHALALTRPVCVIADAAKITTFDEAGGPDLAIAVGQADPPPGWSDYSVLASRGLSLSRISSHPGHPDLELALPFSSGTTGLPKAVRHSHGSLLVATHQWRDSLDIGPSDRLQALTPLSHILGIVNVGAAFAAGATIRLFRTFSPRTMVESFESDRITIGMTVAPIAAALASMEGLESFTLDSLRYLNWSATPVNEAVARRVTQRIGVGWVPAYGTTEVPILAVSPTAVDAGTRLDSVGRPAPEVEIEAIDPVNARMLERGRVGELVARSPAAMLGYLPEDTPTPFLAGGWYRTGDIGYVEPEGWVMVTDRLKELIKVSGHQVSPVEIENLLSTSPLVADCAVYGLPDARRGEVPHAAVVAAPGTVPDAGAILSWLTPQLAEYKRLHGIRFVDSIPRTPSGKVQRRRLGR